MLTKSINDIEKKSDNKLRLMLLLVRGYLE